MTNPDNTQTGKALIDAFEKTHNNNQRTNSPTQPPPTTPEKHPSKSNSKDKPKYRFGNITHEIAEECEPLTNEQFGILIRYLLDYEKNGTIPEICDPLIKVSWNNAVGKFDRMAQISAIRREAVNRRTDRTDK